MNADRLLQAFSMIGEEPARIQQLRQVAVALAIAGKLRADSAALAPDDMVGAVERVKKELYQQQAIPKPKKLKPIEQDELPEHFPEAGRFAPLGSLARVEKGLTGIKQAKPGPFPLVVTGAERATCDHFDFDGAAAIIPLVSSTGHGHASLNRLHYQEGKFAVGTILAAVFPYDPALVSARFIFEYLSAFKEELLVTRMTGTANVTLSVGRIAEVPVPLIDPATQAKLDGLMALLDRLEAARTAREATRDRLTAASLARLTAPDADPAEFPANAHSALAMLPALTTRPDQINPLRQTILNLAVRGKLVEQDSADEPVREVELALKGKARGKSQAVAELPHTLPKNWCWRAIGTIAEQVTDGEHATPPRISETQVPLVTAKNVRNGFMDYSQTDWVSTETAEKAWGRCRPSVNDLLMVCVGATTGRLTVLREPKDMVLVRSVALIRPNREVNPEYLERAIRSPIVQDQIWASVKAAAQPCLYINRIQALLIPLPPLTEQRRIVAKVDALMALCDRLETALTTADTTRARLLGTLLHEALMPDEEREAAA